MSTKVSVTLNESKSKHKSFSTIEVVKIFEKEYKYEQILDNINIFLFVKIRVCC
jgi:hypothetical protein